MVAQTGALSCRWLRKGLPSPAERQHDRRGKWCHLALSGLNSINGKSHVSSAERKQVKTLGEVVERHLGCAGTLPRSATTRCLGPLVLGDHKPLDLKWQWVNHPARPLLPGSPEDVPLPLIWDLRTQGRSPPEVHGERHHLLHTRHELGQGDRKPKSHIHPFSF